MCRLHRLVVEEKKGEEEGVRAGRRRKEEEEGADVEKEKRGVGRRWGEDGKEGKCRFIGEMTK